MASRSKYYDTLGEARIAAQLYANQDDTQWCVWEFAGYISAEPKFEGKPGSSAKLLATVDPGMITIKLTSEEAKHYQEYIETERGYPDGFQGGMYKTETEKSILGKIKAAFVG